MQNAALPMVSHYCKNVEVTEMGQAMQQCVSGWSEEVATSW